MNYPVGFRFHPTEAELVGFYLHHRAAMGTQFQSSEISECPQFYGREEPWVLWENNGGSNVEDGEPLFFFTERKRSNPKSRRFDRKVGSGTWSGQCPNEVKDGDRVIGVRRDFRYEKGSDPDQNNSWLMQEYELCASDALVLCSLKKNPRNPPPSSSSASTSTTAKIDDKKRKATLVDCETRKAKKAEEQPSTSNSYSVDNRNVEVTCNNQDQEHQLVHVVEDQDYYPEPFPELFPDLTQSNDSLFWMEELLGSAPLDVQESVDSVLHLEPSASQDHSSSYQFQEQSYEDCSFTSLLSS